MKRFIPLVLLVLFSIPGKAQNSTTRYDTCQYTAQYAGEWRYVNGNDTIRITLRHVRDYSLQSNRLADRLFGWIEYKQGNTIIESTYQHRFMNLPYDADTRQADLMSILIRPYICNANHRILQGLITDYHQAQESHKVTATVNSTNTQMTWRQDFNEWHGAMTGAYGMTLPREFILTRQ